MGDHIRKHATYEQPEAPPPGAPCVNIFSLPDAVERLQALMRCSDQWNHLQGMEERLTLLSERSPNQDLFAKGGLYEQLAKSFIGDSQLVLATFDGAAQLLESSCQCKPFSVVIVCTAAKSMEAAVLVPLQVARAHRCVLLGDDLPMPLATTRLLHPDCSLTTSSLYERLKKIGVESEHHAPKADHRVSSQ